MPLAAFECVGMGVTAGTLRRPGRVAFIYNHSNKLTRSSGGVNSTIGKTVLTCKLVDTCARLAERPTGALA